MRRFPGLVLFAALLVAIVVALAAASDVLVDWFWFDALGFGAVFLTTWKAKLAVFGMTASLVGGALAINGLLAVRASGSPERRLRLVRGAGDYREVTDLLDFSAATFPWRTFIVTFAVVLGLLLGLYEASNWELFLKWRYAVPFGRSNPVLAHDLEFYMFSLPVYVTLRNLAGVLLLLAVVSALAVYGGRDAIDLTQGVPQVQPRVIRHLSVLFALFFLAKAGDYLLQRYALFLSDNGVVFGAAYTDVHIRLPLLVGLAGLSLLAMVTCAANIRFARLSVLVASVVVVFGTSFISALVPVLVHSYWVKPDELRLESPYITHNIAATRYGFGLDQISVRPFSAAGVLTPEVVAANAETIRNIRWWDPRPLLETYRQLQEIRLYYDFQDVDVDRYTINGTYQEVLLLGRELNQARLAPEAQTWINLHFKFTHGIGLAMSPVNQFDAEGLPVFYLKDIPPVSSVDLPLVRPELYYGAHTGNYVVVGGGTKEFDYPQGQENVYTTYQGRGGVVLHNVWRRALFAWYLGDLKLLISGNVTPTSQLLFRRKIQERIRAVAPFLRLDHDPYLTVSNGRLIWIQDTYTVSDMLPYARQIAPDGVNYIRNAVKVTVDAYDGIPTFYIADPQDPLVRTYQRIFPSLFRPLDQMPQALREHVRYPEDLFFLQAQLYGAYHMTNPEVFYNREDLWSVPQQHDQGKLTVMEPYYTIMRLPGEPRAEFVLMLPMTPSKRDNMITWLAARCDGDHYGEVVEFAFPKDKLVYGPAQIEARIDQDTTISQQLSLWNQLGSRVIRGNLLVIPLEGALLYVEPLYLSAETRELPELKRLIASSGDRVVMSQSVEALLTALSTGEAAQPSVVTATGAVVSTPPTAQPSPDGAATLALTHYRQALEALRRGDWSTFGTEMDALQKALEGTAEAGPTS